MQERNARKSRPPGTFRGIILVPPYMILPSLGRNGLGMWKICNHDIREKNASGGRSI